MLVKLGKRCNSWRQETGQETEDGSISFEDEHTVNIHFNNVKYKVDPESSLFHFLRKQLQSGKCSENIPLIDVYVSRSDIINYHHDPRWENDSSALEKHLSHKLPKEAYASLSDYGIF